MGGQIGPGCTQQVTSISTLRTRAECNDGRLGLGRQAARMIHSTEDKQPATLKKKKLQERECDVSARKHGKVWRCHRNRHKIHVYETAELPVLSVDTQIRGG